MTVPDVKNWGDDGNLDYGDCGVAGVDHVFKADAATTGLYDAESWPTRNEIVNYYFKYTGGQDSGVVLADFLAYVRKNGFLRGHTISAYAPVSVHDIPTIQAATWLYDSTYTGIVVTEAMQQAFEDEVPWNTSQLSSPVAGGHCVPLVGFDDKHLYCVTWGEIQPITYPMWHYISSEAWAIITGEFDKRGGDGHGVWLRYLKDDLDKLA